MSGIRPSPSAVVAAIAEMTIEELSEMQRSIFQRLIEHDKVNPGAVDAFVVSLVSHLRSWRPVAISPLGTLPDPDSPNVDPRGAT